MPSSVAITQSRPGSRPSASVRMASRLLYTASKKSLATAKRSEQGGPRCVASEGEAPLPCVFQRLITTPWQHHGGVTLLARLNPRGWGAANGAPPKGLDVTEGMMQETERCMKPTLANCGPQRLHLSRCGLRYVLYRSNISAYG